MGRGRGAGGEGGGWWIGGLEGRGGTWAARHTACFQGPVKSNRETPRKFFFLTRGLQGYQTSTIPARSLKISPSPPSGGGENKAQVQKWASEIWISGCCTRAE